MSTTCTPAPFSSGARRGTALPSWRCQTARVPAGSPHSKAHVMWPLNDGLARHSPCPRTLCHPDEVPGGLTHPGRHHSPNRQLLHPGRSRPSHLSAAALHLDASRVAALSARLLRRSQSPRAPPQRCPLRLRPAIPAYRGVLCAPSLSPGVCA